MKKKILSIIFIFALCIILTGCMNNTYNSVEVIDDNNSSSITLEENNLKEPEVEWCKLYNPNGYNTLTCLIKNNNDIDIDYYYDVEFYKDGKKVEPKNLDEYENWQNLSIEPGKEALVWYNHELPSANEVDEVRLVNGVVNEAYSPSISSTYKKVREEGRYIYYNIKANKIGNGTAVWVMYYNDNNNDKKVQKNELVVCGLYNVKSKDDEIAIETGVYDYTDLYILPNLY